MSLTQTEETTPNRYPAPATSIGVRGTGAYLPNRLVHNDEVGTAAGVDDEWITRKTGIHTRRWADPTEATSDLCLVAASRALEQAEVTAEQLSLIVVATSTPDSPQPPAAAAVASRLNAPASAAAFDLNAVCSGFVFALDVARRFLAAGGTGYAIVIGADIYSRITDPQDRRTAVLLADGAGAAVLGPEPPGQGIQATQLLTFGGYRDLVRVPAGGSRLPTSATTLAEGSHYFTMHGGAVAEFVRDHVPAAIESLLHDCDIAADRIEHLVPHQANVHLIRSLEEDLALPRATLHTTADRYGNTGAASVAVTLDEAVRAKEIVAGQTVLLAAFGGGMSLGLALVRW